MVVVRARATRARSIHCERSELGEADAANKLGEVNERGHSKRAPTTGRGFRGTSSRTRTNDRARDTSRLSDRNAFLAPGPQQRPCSGVPRLLVEKFSGDEVPVHDELPVTVEADTADVRVRVGDEDRTLTRSQAAALRDALAEALTRRRTFVHTACEHREDGAYVVERRGADSAGHRKVFESFERCRGLYDRLPAEFAAEDVQHAGVTAGRRHMLVWHFVEHDAFDCELVSRQPLTARKPGADAAAGREEVSGPGD